MADGRADFNEFIDFEGAKKLLLEAEKDFDRFVDNLSKSRKRLEGDLESLGKTYKENLEIMKSIDKTQINALDSFKQVGQQLDKTAASAMNQKEAIQAVDKITETYSKSVEDQKQKLKELNDIYNKLDPTLEENKDAIVKIGKEVRETKNNIKELTDVTKRANNVFEAAENSYNALARANVKLKNELKNLPVFADKTSKAFKETEQRAEKLKTQISDNTTKLKEFDKSLGDNFRNVGNYPELLGELKGAFGGVFAAGGPVTVAIAALAALGAAIKALSEEILEFNKLLETTQNITKQTGDQLIATTASIKATADTFDQDFNEVLRASNAVSKEFGKSITEVNELINIAFASGANLSGDFLDNLREYAPQLKQAGFALEDFIKLNILSAQEGAFNDKLVDTIKEVNLRLGDLNKGQKEALSSLGAVGTQVETLFAGGRQREAIILLSSELSKLEKQGKNIQPVLSNLFGAAGEDLGVRLIDIISKTDQYNISLSDSQKLTLEVLASTERYNKQLGKLANDFTGTNKELDIFINNLKTNLLSALNDLVIFFSEDGELAQAIEAFVRSNLALLTVGLSEIIRLLGVLEQTSIGVIEELEPKENPYDNVQGSLNSLIETVLELEKAENKANNKRESSLDSQKRDIDEILEIQKKGFEDIQEGIIETTDVAEAEAKRRTRVEKLESEKRIKISEEEQEEIKRALISGSFQTADTLGNQLFINNRIRRDNELQSLQQQKETELALAGNNALAREAIEKKFTEEQNKIRKEQAEAQKRQTIFNILLSTAEAITAALPNLVLAGIVAGVGTVQLAAASSQPIPQFFEGTEDTGLGGSIDSKGGFQAVLHPRERVLPKKENKRLGFGRMTNAELVDNALLGERLTNRMLTIDDLIGKFDPIMQGNIKMTHDVTEADRQYRERLIEKSKPEPIDYKKLGKAVASNLPAITEVHIHKDGTVETYKKRGGYREKTNSVKIQPNKEAIQEIKDRIGEEGGEWLYE